MYLGVMRECFLLKRHQVNSFAVKRPGQMLYVQSALGMVGEMSSRFQHGRKSAACLHRIYDLCHMAPVLSISESCHRSLHAAKKVISCPRKRRDSMPSSISELLICVRCSHENTGQLGNVYFSMCAPIKGH